MLIYVEKMLQRFMLSVLEDSRGYTNFRAPMLNINIKVHSSVHDAVIHRYSASLVAATNIHTYI